MKLCVKGFPNRLRNGREKRENTDTQTHTHFRIYICRDRKCFDSIDRNALILVLERNGIKGPFFKP